MTAIQLFNHMIKFANDRLPMHSPLSRRLYLGDNIACLAEKHLRQEMIELLIRSTDKEVLKGKP